jgi:outer membrane protein OmpA-like peptidoglycan-associated protein
MKKHLLTTLTICFVLITSATAQTKSKFLDTLRLGIRYQVQEFHTLNQKLKEQENCNCDESLPLNGRALQGISASIYEPITDNWSVGADLGGSFGTVMDDNRAYKKYSFVQMRVESFYHLFDAKTKLRPYVTGSIQLAANQRKALFSLPLGAGLRYQLNKGGSIHVQTAYDRGFSHSLARNMITNVGFHVPLFKPKASSVNSSSLYETMTANVSSKVSNPPSQISDLKSQISNTTSQISNLTSNVSNLTSNISNLPKKRLARVIYFDTDKNGLNKAETDKIMAEVLAFMAENKGTRVYLYGHTDNVQSEAYNLRLSKTRVDATTEKLIKLGIVSDRIEGKYYGESSPVANNKYESGRAANRRVEIVVM